MAPGRLALLALIFLPVGSAGCKSSVSKSPERIPNKAAPDARPPETKAVPSGYDPIAMIDQGASAIDVFMAESRHPTWAPAVESVIGGSLRRDLETLVPEVRRFGMTCRTLSCVMEVDAPRQVLPAAMEVLGLVTLGPITVALPPTPEGKARMLFVTDRRMGDPDTFTSWYVGARRRTLTDIRSGKRPPLGPFPSESLPTE